MITATTKTIAPKTHSIVFQKDVLIFTYSSTGKLFSSREMSYKKFFALNLSEFTFKTDCCKRIPKLEKQGYKVTNLVPDYKFQAVKK